MMRKVRVLVYLSSALLALPVLAGLPQTVQKYPVATAVTPALRSLPKERPEGAPATHKVIPNHAVTKQMSPSAGTAGPQDPLVQKTEPAGPMPNALLNMDGITNLDGVAPPDTEGDIGPNDYVQWVNLHIQGWTIDRNAWTATSAFGPIAANTLWAPLGGPCAADNWGDPIVLWDSFRSR